MKNCEVKLDGNILTITLDISKEFGKSLSGKSIIVGSTEGNASISEIESQYAIIPFSNSSYFHPYPE